MTYEKSSARTRWTAAEVKEFCGWDFLQRMVESAGLPRTKLLIAAGFLTGGRISETLQLSQKHFDFQMDSLMVVVRTMPVVKRYKKVGTREKWKCDGHCKMRWGTHQVPRAPTPDELNGHRIVAYSGWETRPETSYRTFPFPKNELLVPVLQDLMNGGDDRLFDVGYAAAYKDMTDLGRELGVWIPTHWFRAQRASQLALEYGFSEHELAEWFLWRDYQTAWIYARKGYRGLAAKMVRGA